MIESIVRNMILANNYLRDFLEEKVYLNRLPRNFSLPAIVVTREGGIGGRETFYWDEAVINLTVYAKEITILDNMYEKYVDGKWLGINPLLHKKYNYVRKKGNIDVIIQRSIRTRGPYTKLEPELQIYSMDLFYNFRYRVKNWDRR